MLGLQPNAICALRQGAGMHNICTMYANAKAVTVINPCRMECARTKDLGVPIKDARATVLESIRVNPTGCRWLLTIIGIGNLMGKLLSNCRKIPSMGEGTYAQHAPGVVLVVSEAPYANVTSVVMQGVP